MSVFEGMNFTTASMDMTATTEILQFNTTQYIYAPPFDTAGVILTCIILLPLAIFGIAANILTIVVIMTSPKLKTSVFNYFIVSLCASDLTSSIISPLFAYRRTWGFNFWAWSDFLCKLAWGLDIWTSYVTSTHILLFAILRFISVQWPHSFSAIKSRHAKIAISVVWLCAFCIGFIPMVSWFGATKRDRSINSPTSKWPSCTLNAQWIPQFKLYTYIGYSIMFYLPICLVVLLSIMIWLKVYDMRRSRRKAVTQAKRTSGSQDKAPLEMKRRRKENQIMLQLSLIVGSFLFGYVPQTVFHFYTPNNPAITEAEKRKDWILGSVVYMALRISECLNPVFYNLASSKMRKETKKTLRALIAKLKCWKHAGDASFTSSGTGMSSSAANHLQL